MSILVRQATIKDINSPHHNKVKDIFIENGIIKEIADHLERSADSIIQETGIYISPGWIDIFVTGTDPGYEFKDTLSSTAASAAKGGFTHLFLTPNTNPVIQNKATVEYIKSKTLKHPVQLHPLGAVTKNTEGTELTEIYDMKASGAIAFSDGTKPIQSSGLMIKALQYVSAFNGIILQLPDDRTIAPHGLMNEGIVSTKIGLPGKPALAEEIMIARDIALAKYTGSHVHITGLSLATGVEMIRKAKKEGIKISCSCTPQHLLFTDEDLIDGYNTNLKVNPPLRSATDRAALISGVKDGTIDCITTHHTAQHKDAKVCEFEYAGYGTLGLESAFGALNNISLEVDQILTAICFNPRDLFMINGSIKEGSTADVTLFVPETLGWKHNSGYHSLSSNNAFEQTMLKGKIVGTILQHNIYINKNA